MGLRLDHTRADMARAVMEGLAFNNRWTRGPAERLIGRPIDHFRFSGGGALSDVWSQILADRIIAGLFFFRLAYTACIGIIWGFLPVFADSGVMATGLLAEHGADATRTVMTDAGLEPEDSELTMRASTNAELEVEDARKVLRLIDLLETSDDVQDVFYNADIPQEAYEAEG